MEEASPEPDTPAAWTQLVEWEMRLPAFTEVDACVPVSEDVSNDQMETAWNDDNPSHGEKEEIAQDVPCP